MTETRSAVVLAGAEEFAPGLENGSHQGPDEGVCLMEAVACWRDRTAINRNASARCSARSTARPQRVWTSSDEGG